MNLNRLLTPLVIVGLTSLSACSEKLTSNRSTGGYSSTGGKDAETFIATQISPSTHTTSRTLLKSATSLSGGILVQPSILASEILVFEAIKNVEIEKSAIALQSDFSLNGGATRLRELEGGAVGSVSLSKLIADNGVTANKIDAAKARAKVAYFNYRKVAEEFIFTALSSLTSYNATQSLSELASYRKEEANVIYQKLNALKLAGQIDSTIINDAQNNVDKLNLLSNDLETDLEIRKSEVEILFGSALGELQINVAEILTQYDKFVGLLNVEDPESLKLNEQKKALNFELAATKATNFGNLSFNSSLDVPITNGTELPDASVGLIFTRVISDGKRKDSIAETLKLQAMSIDNQLNSQDKIFKTANMTLKTTISKLDDGIALRNRMILDSENNLVSLENQLSIGITDFSKLLNAKINLFNLERDQVLAKQQRVLAKLELLKLRGQLLEIANIKLPVNLPFVQQ